MKTKPAMTGAPIIPRTGIAFTKSAPIVRRGIHRAPAAAFNSRQGVGASSETSVVFNQSHLAQFGGTKYKRPLSRAALYATFLANLVGASGFEPPTSRSRMKRSRKELTN